MATTSTVPDPSKDPQGANRRKVLFIDDEPSVLRMLQFGLQDVQHEVRTATSGEDGLLLAEQWRPDLVLLDLLISDLDGYEISRRLRRFTTVPIIVVTALRSGQTFADCLEAGADECITKPFSVSELASRVRSALRRHERPLSGVSGEKIAYDRGRFRIDPVNRLAWQDDEVVPLSSVQYRLLAYLAAHPNEALTYADVYEQVWGTDEPLDLPLLGTHVALLERQLDENPRRLRYIAPVEGTGYRFISH